MQDIFREVYNRRVARQRIYVYIVIQQYYYLDDWICRVHIWIVHGLSDFRQWDIELGYDRGI